MIDKTYGKGGKTAEKDCLQCKQKMLCLMIKIRQGESKFCSKQCYEDYRKSIKIDDKLLNKNSQLKNKYKITLEQYNELVIQQNNLCLICKSPPGKKQLFIDHCHISGKVRGLLCSNCNTGLGMFKDDPNLMAVAIKYLAGEKIL